MDDRSGQTIKGYQLREEIGIGGFGAVYRAYQSAVDREVAIKVILPKYANHPNFVQRFDAEAKIVARLEHPHIVPLFDYWHDDNGAYLVMQWMGGGNLHHSLEKQGAWSLERIRKLLDQISAALMAAHKRNVVHRDIKPANILLDSDGNAYLADFGIAKDLQSDAHLTQENSILGSPAYLSPEQIRGEKISAQTDIYSLGIVLYELLTGKHPFEGASTKTMIAKHRKETLPSLQLSSINLPVALDAIIQRATAKEPTARYSDVASLAKSFHHALKSLDLTLINEDQAQEENTNPIPVRKPIPDETVVPLPTGNLQARLYEKSATILEKPRRLIGRDKVLKKINRLIDEQEPILLHGFGGMGKTALAASVAATFIESNKKSVLWLEMGAKSTGMVFEALAKAIGKQSDIAEKTGDERVMAMREILADFDGLLVLDNVWNEHTLFQTMRGLPPLLPVIITSRYTMPIDGEVIDIEALPDDDALTLLSYHARQKYTDNKDAGELCTKLGNHPFALEIAGKQLKVLRHLTPNQLLKDIAEAPHNLEIPGEFSEIGRRGIKDLFDSSVNELNLKQREVFSSLGAMSSPTATVQLLSLVLKRDEKVVEDSLVGLKRRGLLDLISEKDIPKHYRIHDLTHSYARAMFQNENIGYTPVFDAIKKFTSDHAEDHDLLDFEQGNILGIASIAQIKSVNDILIDVMKVLTLDGYLNTRGHTPLFLECLDSAIEASRKSDKVDKEILHHLLSKRGNAFKDRGDIDAALRAYQEALQLAPNPNREAILLSVIGMTLYQSKGSGAEEYFEKAYQVAKANNDDMALSFVLDYRGGLAIFQENYEAAEKHLKEAVAVAERLNDLARLFFSLQNLGTAQECLGIPKTGLQTHQRALKIAEDESNHRWKALALHSIAEDYHAMKNRAKAQQHYDEALTLYRRLGVLEKANEIIEFLEKENYTILTE